MKKVIYLFIIMIFIFSSLAAMHPKKEPTDLFNMKISASNSFYSYYRNLINDNDNILLTSDFLFYTEHLILDYSLRYTEEEHLYGMVDKMLDSLISEFENNWKGVKAKKTLSGKTMVLSYLYVSKSLLNSSTIVPEQLKSNVESELEKIFKAAGFQKSSIFSKEEDYSQYIPRGHYNDSEKLRRYFRALMYLQRMGFNTEIKSEDVYSELRAALMLSETLAKMNGRISVYSEIKDIISVLLQQQDDLSLTELRTLWKHGVSESELQNDKFMKELASAAENSSRSKIISSLVADTDKTPVFMNLLGQRYIFDSELFQNLVYNKVLEYQRSGRDAFTLGSGIRHLPRGLDLMYVLGSTNAYLIMENEGDVQYKNYKENVKLMKEVYSSMNKSESFYNRMLSQYENVIKSERETAPIFMLDSKWALKELNTMLSSWASLRHDVILYAKQSYTVKATSAMPGKEIQPEKHFIAEPYLGLYKQMKEDVAFLASRLASKTSDNIYNDINSSFSALNTLYVDVSVATQKGKIYSDNTAALDAINQMDNSLKKLLKNKVEKEDNSIFVADVHTDVNSNIVLEEASGPLAVIEVIYKDINYTGGALTYFEFKHPMNDRLTDEKWREIAVHDDLSNMLFKWQKDILK